MENPLDTSSESHPTPVSPSSPLSPLPEVKKARRVVSKETIEAQFQHLRELIETRMTDVRNEKVTGNLRFLRGLLARLREVSKDVDRVVNKPQKRVNRSASQNSGFLKGHPITPEFAEFAGCDVEALKSRVEITKVISKYVQDHGLKHSTNNKLIVPDTRLSTLLGVSEPFDYATLQKHIGKFQVK